MKKTKFILAILVLLAFFVKAQDPVVYWQFANEQYINSPTELQFDVQVHTDQTGTYMRDMQVYFNYSPDQFGFNVLANGNITYTLIGIMDDPGVVGNPFYPLYGIVNDADNTSVRYAIITETMYPNKYGGEVFNFLGTDYPYNLEMPTSYVDFLRFTLNVVDCNQPAGINFETTIMDGGQYWTGPANADPLPYATAGVYENDLNNLICVQPANVWTGAIDSVWSNPDNWSLGTVPAGEDVEIPNVTKAPSPVILGPGAIVGSLTIMSGANLTINDIGNLSATGTITNNGDLMIESSTTDGTGMSGSLIDNGTIAGTGTYTFSRWLSSGCGFNDPWGDSWNYVSSPIPDAISGDFMHCYLKEWDETTSFFYDVDPTPPPGPYTVPLNVMQGYAVEYCDSTNNPGGPTEFKEVVFASNAFNTGNYTYNNITAVGPPIPHPPNTNGWNLLGNPYPSGLDIELMTFGVNTAPTVYYWDEEDLLYYSYVQTVGGSGSQYIPPTQGFFVEAVGPDALTVTNAERTHNGQGMYYKSENGNVVILSAGKDEAWIVINEAASPGYEMLNDAYKLFSNATELGQIYSYGEDVSMSVNSMPYTDLVHVGFSAPEGSVNTIEASHIGDEFSHVVLEDTYTGEQTDLTSGSYTFTATADDHNRFQLHFTPLGLGDQDIDEVNIYSNENIVYVSVPSDINGTIAVYNLVGQEVANVSIENGLNEIAINGDAGYYVVKLIAANQVVTEKVLIQ